MTRDQLIWIKLAEEANEAAQELVHIALKISQLGLGHAQTGMPENQTRLAAEIADLEAMFALLELKGYLPYRSPAERTAAIQAKWAKLEKWAQVSEELGFVTPEEK